MATGWKGCQWFLHQLHVEKDLDQESGSGQASPKEEKAEAKRLRKRRRMPMIKIAKGPEQVSVARSSVQVLAK